MIYIAAHKKCDIPKMEGYIPLQVGAKGKESLGFQRDDEGDNISEKNPNFCELTGLYWIWKNKDDDYKGLVHYRRYFGRSNLSSKMSDIYSYDDLKDMLKDADMVLPYVENFKQNAKEEILISCCTEEIFRKLKNTINELYPDYMTTFDRFWESNHASLFNMFFSNFEIFDAYCEWLFTILFKLESIVDISDLNDYQKRLYGFLSERLLNIWVMHNDLRIKNVPVITTEMKLSEKLLLLRRRYTNEIIFRMHNSLKNK